MLILFGGFVKLLEGLAKSAFLWYIVLTETYCGAPAGVNRAGRISWRERNDPNFKNFPSGASFPKVG